MLKDKTILFIVHNYNSFQKDQIESIAKYFKKVYVLVRSKPFPSIVKYISKRWLPLFDESYTIDLVELPSNVSVIKTPVLYIPFGILNRYIGISHLKAVEKAINNSDIDFDLIHSHFIWSSGYVGMKLKEKYGVPLIVTGHGYDVYQLPFSSTWWGNKIKTILAATDKVITVSKKNLSYLKKLNVKSNITVIPNGYNSKNFYPRDRMVCRTSLGLPLNKKIVLSVGNLNEVKGHEYLIKAFKTLTNSYKDMMCVVVGDGTLKTKLNKLVKIYGLDEFVFFVGKKPHFEIPLWMNSANIFVLPSINEGNPTVMFECLACNIPFIGTNVGGIPEIITPDTGIVVEPKDPEALSIAIKKLLNQMNEKRDVNETVRQFTWDKIGGNIMKIYRQLIV